MAGLINSVVGFLVDVLLWPFRALGPWPALVAASLLTGLLMLAVFKAASNQEGIRRTKDRIKAHLLELRLYKHDFGQTMRSQGRVLLANGRYLGHALRPMLVMAAPVVLLLFQLDAWFGVRPLAVGERTLVKVRLSATASPLATPLVLAAPAGVEVETPPLRIEEEREIDWRIRAAAAGRHEIKIAGAGGEPIPATVAVGPEKLRKILAVPAETGFFRQLEHPGGLSLPKGGPVESITIAYPAARLSLFGRRLHWLAVFFVLSIVFGFALKGVFKVEI